MTNRVKNQASLFKNCSFYVGGRSKRDKEVSEKREERLKSGLL
jgi:hypothetical protein